MSEEKLTEEDSLAYTTNIEGQKLFYDLFKHLTTVSTGSILILAAFLEKFFKEPHWRPLIIIAFAGFIISIIASVLSMFAFADVVGRQWQISKAGIMWRRDQDSDSGVYFYVTSVIFALGGFILGIIALVVFVVRNLY